MRAYDDRGRDMRSAGHDMRRTGTDGGHTNVWSRTIARIEVCNVLVVGGIDGAISC